MFESVSYGLVILLGVLFLTFIRRALINSILKISEEKPSTKGDKNYADYKEVYPKKWLRYDSDSDNEVTVQQVFYYIFKYGSCLTGFILITDNLSSFIKVTFFPKLYLVEKFIELI